ncbi:MAG: hypothetical protein PHE86_01750 [Candidatus Marinimicrobia bacterium]|nr:hypothetical protein [Candidatus Neomarinimicrobiota bacterium]MDD5583085.1 hypothetical protein [Candidatus Neomarinimicrobiota bacterium]
MIKYLIYILVIYLVVTIYRRIIRPEIIKWLEKKNQKPRIHNNTPEDGNSQKEIPKEDIIDVDFKEEK